MTGPYSAGEYGAAVASAWKQTFGTDPTCMACGSTALGDFLMLPVKTGDNILGMTATGDGVMLLCEVCADEV
jgi:hypothetical protein